jgi:hypothetical protein
MRKAILMMLLAVVSGSAVAQPNLQGITMDCEAYVGQMYLMCGRTNQTGSLAGHGQQCPMAMQNINARCYFRDFPQLGCSTASKESQFWCGGYYDPSLAGSMAGRQCAEAQAKFRNFCSR